MTQAFLQPLPTRGPVDSVGPDGKPREVNRPWAAPLQQMWQVCFASQQAGTTARRPTVSLWIGRIYFDTTLGYPIWWDGTQWVDATGTPA